MQLMPQSVGENGDLLARTAKSFDASAIIGVKDRRLVL